MKRYLLTGVAALCIGAEASENPFDLRKNLQNLDTEQNSLLTELRKSVKDDNMIEEKATGEIKTAAPEKTSIKTEASQEVQAPKSVPAKPIEAPIPVTENVSTPVEANTTQTSSKEESKEEKVVVESEQKPEKVVIDVKMPEADKKEVAPQSKNPIETQQPTKEENVNIIKAETVLPQQNDVNSKKENPMTQEEIEKLYLEAIKEVGGK